jgi:nitrite reductase (NADH) large subunit
MKNYLIVGNGVAGTTAAENVRKQDKEGKITIVTDEDFPFYWRLRLNEYLAGDLTEEALAAKKAQWYGDQRIDLKLKTLIAGADPNEKVVFTEDKQRLSYDSLLIATGSHSFIPPIKGSEKEGVFALRNIQDARGISVWAKDIEDVVLIGGGLLWWSFSQGFYRGSWMQTVLKGFRKSWKRWGFHSGSGPGHRRYPETIR